ncbi:hypothetical protein [Adlercreutzia sp. ZJ304]|uniref:DUF7657 domain-containing protein n=1 Tax=Adlercreutzia sp. ZJ304 TaxID=2709791 RepID=UPI0013ED763F|nr:hypothetical protein [Adlercreutzia sp. ZJ304]
MKSLTIKNQHNVGKKWLAFIVLGILLPLALCIYILLVEATTFSNMSWGSLLSLRFLLIWIPCLLIGYGIAFHFRCFTNTIFRYRWLIACCLFVLCVLFEISGSSIAQLAAAAGGNSDVLFGVSRPIRSDEWAVFTPMAFSQVASDGGSFSYFQDTLRATETDMFGVYGQPVWDIAEIFRPFQWGYLILGAAKGLAFFWCGRFIFLFMVSFEFGYRFLVRGSKPLALGYAFMVAFAPIVQWWFSVNGLVEMLLFGQLALMWAQCYLKTESYAKRSLYTLGITWCLGIYVFVFYPAWQVPLAYIFLALLVALLIQELPSAYKSWRDIALCLCAILILCFAVAYVFLFKSADTIAQVMNTVYPGQRNSAGGGAELLLFDYVVCLISPIDNSGITPNVCEAATFFTGFPLCIVLALIVLYRNSSSRSLVAPLLVVCIFLLVYGVVGFPEIISKVTLLGKSTAPRATAVATFGLLLVMFASIKYLKPISVRVAIPAVLACWAIAIACFYVLSTHSVSSSRLAFAFALVLVFMASAMFSFTYIGKKIFCAICIVIGLLGGGLVNPINVGIDGYKSSELLRDIESVNSENDVWAAVNIPLVSTNNIGITSGAKTINSTNTYPQLETWKKLDTNGNFEDIYNRYAHIAINIKDEGDPEFSLISADAFSLALTADDLANLDVTKIYSSDPNLDNYSSSQTQILPLDTEGSFYTYELVNAS